MVRTHQLDGTASSAGRAAPADGHRRRQMADDQAKSKLFGESLPGTGGDFIDTNDVEGHMPSNHLSPKPLNSIPGKNLVGSATEGDVDGHAIPGKNLVGSATDGEGAIPGKNLTGSAIPGKNLTGSLSGEEDTEGHAIPGKNLVGSAIPGKNLTGSAIPGKNLVGSATDEDDVEGHIFTGGPSTQDEFAKRGPGENPHGER